MKKTWIIIEREYLTRVRKKTFVISTLLFPLLYVALIGGMGFIAENLREKHIEDERSEELMHAFISDVKENQKQLDSLIINNQRLSRYYDSMAFDNGFGKRQVDLIKLSDELDFKMYRFINKKTIFEQMKSSGALRYIQDKEILKSMLRYEENADYAERVSMDNETDHYNNRFRATIDEILPLSFYKYISESNLKTITKMDSLVNPGRYENYKIYGAEIKKDLENTKFTKEDNANAFDGKTYRKKISKKLKEKEIENENEKNLDSFANGKNKKVELNDSNNIINDINEIMNASYIDV